MNRPKGELESRSNYDASFVGMIVFVNSCDTGYGDAYNLYVVA